WLCRCDCGAEHIVRGSTLYTGVSKSCGCIRRIGPIDLTGQRFGCWTVLAIHPERYRGAAILWLCRCDCGAERVVRGSSLRTGGSTHCGCRNIELIKKHKTTHGMSKTRAYRILAGMLQRCFNPNDKSYCYYGGREPPE